MGQLRGQRAPGSTCAMALVHDLTRGFKRKNFWVMETQPGIVNWARDQQRARQGRDPRDGVGGHWSRRGCGRVLAVA